MGATMGGRSGGTRNAQWAGAQRDAALGGANVPINQIVGTVARTPGGVPGGGYPQTMPAGGGTAQGGIPNLGGQPQGGQNPYGGLQQMLQRYLMQQQGGGFGGGGYPSTYGAPGGLYALPSGGYNYGQGGGGYGGLGNYAAQFGGFDPYQASRQMALQQLFGGFGGY